MPALLKFYAGGVSRTEYRNLTIPEYNALLEYMVETARQIEKANRG